MDRDALSGWRAWDNACRTIVPATATMARPLTACRPKTSWPAVVLSPSAVGELRDDNLDNDEPSDQTGHPDQSPGHAGQCGDDCHQDRYEEDHVPERAMGPEGLVVGCAAERAARGEVELRHDEQHEQDRQAGKDLTQWVHEGHGRVKDEGVSSDDKRPWIRRPA